MSTVKMGDFVEIGMYCPRWRRGYLIKDEVVWSLRIERIDPNERHSLDFMRDEYRGLRLTLVYFGLHG